MMNGYLNDRPRRTKLVSKGVIFFGGVELNVTVNNISINGVLLQLDQLGIDIEYVFTQLYVSTMVDLYLPELRLIGEAEIVRSDITKDGRILLAMEFKDIAFTIEEDLNKRQCYRRNIAYPGKILLNGHHYDFTTLNVSLGGLMVVLSEVVDVQAGTTTSFECKRLGLDGEIKVMWVDSVYDGNTRLGLQFINGENKKLEKSIPRFFTK
jgi:hypothetical protein